MGLLLVPHCYDCTDYVPLVSVLSLVSMLSAMLCTVFQPPPPSLSLPCHRTPFTFVDALFGQIDDGSATVIGFPTCTPAWHVPLWHLIFSVWNLDGDPLVHVFFCTVFPSVAPCPPRCMENQRWLPPPHVLQHGTYFCGTSQCPPPLSSG